MSEKKYVPHQQRVVDEKTELDTKVEALGKFIHGNGDGLYGEVYRTLPKDERLRLVKQLNLMGQYSEVLGERIENF